MGGSPSLLRKKIQVVFVPGVQANPGHMRLSFPGDLRKWRRQLVICLPNNQLASLGNVKHAKPSDAKWEPSHNMGPHSERPTCLCHIYGEHAFSAPKLLFLKF